MAKPHFLESRCCPWPLPALGAWGLAWALFTLLRGAETAVWAAALGATALGAGSAVMAPSPWRRAIVAGGFPLSLAVSGIGSALPGWSWLVPLALLVLLYPLGAWRDAPLFPTPAGTLRDLPKQVPLPTGARVLDGGCGLGAGLRELRRAYPQAHFDGIERSWPLWLVCAWRCRFARVRRADLWAADWSGFDVVYLFQRPESMARAVEKARRELRPGAWLVSLEFEAPGLAATPLEPRPGTRPVWAYRVPFQPEGRRLP